MEPLAEAGPDDGRRDSRRGRPSDTGRDEELALEGESSSKPDIRLRERP